MLFALARKDSSLELYGIDPSQSMLRRARKKLGDAQSISLHLMLGSSRVIPFTETFDLIFTSLSFHHWAYKEGSIPYVMSKLNANGSFVIYEFDRNAQGFLRRAAIGRHALSTEEANSLDAFNSHKRVTPNGHFIRVVYTKLS